MAEVIVDARRAVLHRLFDNAAMFPPARLSLADALELHRGHKRGPTGWLVRRLLIRASDARTFLDSLSETDFVELGVVLDRGGVGNFADTVAGDIQLLSVIARDERVELTGIEVRLLGDDPEAEVSAVLTGLEGGRLPGRPSVAIEVPVAGRPAGEVLAGLKAIEVARHSARRGDDLAAKIRCGGTEPGTVPEDVEVAGFLLACAERRIPFKATAGLHHPKRTPNPATGDLEHGFLNLVGAAVEAQGGSKLAAIERAVARLPDQVRLGPGALVVGDTVLESETITTLRETFFQGIGCCDIHEVARDLATEGILDETGSLK